MDRKLPVFFLILFVAQQVLCAPLDVRAQEASPPGAKSADLAGASAKHRLDKKVAVKAKRNEAKGKEKSSKGIHAPAWAFGSASQSREALREGVSTSDLQKRAVGDEAAKDNSINTTSGINSALKSANAKNERKNGLALSVGQEESGWRKKSQLEPEAADENVPMQSRHVVRAYADVDAGDDLNVSVGPELILKDEQRERAAANKQPDSALGMGMQFKLGF
ncbi:hypothetical protein DDIC_11965 [Desulfovibrio desulfuricans]|uniref:Uncharacterized protein n=1 Tax=Desulfovibrio desulfuricans TaxID=876 RepID=A0A4P7UNG9_DESDE|nr:hypothetical protein [Desulfovibrio desulfuricans]QCC86578.1 hypothetical protein DDIC_11965 [Desulfovibrio desulfuricans]